MPENFANRYQTALAAGVTSGAATGTVTSVTGVPDVPFRGIISAEGANADEIVLVTGQAGTTLTWTRAAEAVAGVQAASAHAIGATFTAIVTAGLLNAAYVNAHAYGAKGDGVADDTAALQAAITATPIGGTLFIPQGAAGVYNISATLVCPDPIRIIGDGTHFHAPRLLMVTVNETALSFTSAVIGTGVQASVVEHLDIATNAAQAAGNDGIYALADVRLEHVFIQGFYDGLRLGINSYFSWVRACQFQSNVRAGIRLDDGVNNFTVSESSFWLGAVGIQSISVQSLRVRDCAFEVLTSAGVEVDGGDGGIVIEGNYFECTGAGSTNIIIGPTTALDGVVITGNWFDAAHAASYHTELDNVSRVTFIGNAYRGVGLGVARGTANTSRVEFINQKTNGVTDIAVPFPDYAYSLDVLNTPDIEGYWPLNEKAGAVAIDLTNLSDGNIVGAPTMGVVGPLLDPTTAITLNGSSQRVNRSTIIGTPAALSWEIWFNASAWTTGALMAAWDTVDGSMIHCDASTLYMFTNGVFVSVAEPATGAWHHLVGMTDGTNSSLYIDGALVAGPTAKAYTPLTSGTLQYILIGAYYDGSYHYFTGSLAHAAYYSRALTTAEVNRHYRVGTGT